MIAAIEDAHDRLSLQWGALPARRVIWGLALLFSVWVMLDVFVLHWSGGIRQASYDAMVRARVVTGSTDPRIVIVDINEASLARMAPEFGRWPWPRDTLATVLDHIEKQQPAAIVWDIVFSDADRISPGGDAAFNAAVQRSAHSVFPVVRLPAASDADSAISRAVLPTLWAAPPPSAVANNSNGTAPLQPGTLALIAPALPAVAAARLGYNNGYADADGVLRRYRYFETLPDGSTVQSIAMGAVALADPAAFGRALKRQTDAGATQDALIAWRASASGYPAVAFADVFAKADGTRALTEVPSFAGKVVVIGSTAASLHDIHPTPMSPGQAGVQSLATAIDNALNERHIAELPRWLQATVAIALCLGLALWVQTRKIASLTPMVFLVPVALLCFNYASLNGAPVFVDLHLSAGLALLFLAMLRYWNRLRRRYWCTVAEPAPAALLLWPLHRTDPWTEEPLDRLIDAVAQLAPNCRVVVPDLFAFPLHPMRWPALGLGAAIVGPAADLLRLHGALLARVSHLADSSGKMRELAAGASRNDIARCAMQAWVEAR